MNARVDLDTLLPELDQRHLDWLEEEAIFILREVAATFERRVSRSTRAFMRGLQSVKSVTRRCQA